MISDVAIKFIQERNNWVKFNNAVMAQVYYDKPAYQFGSVREHVVFLAGLNDPYSKLGTDVAIFKRKNGEKVVAVCKEKNNEAFFTRDDELIKYLPTEIANLLK